jgi:hypothetical protein
MFWCVVPLNLAGDAASLSRSKALIQAGRMMDVQIVYDEDNPFRVWIDNIHQVAQDLCEVEIGSPFPHPYASEATQWLHSQEECAGAMPLILVVLSLGLSRLQ